MGQKASSILCLVKKLRKRKAQTITGNLMRKTAHFYAVLFVFFLCPYSFILIPFYLYASCLRCQTTPPLGGRGALAEILQGRTQGLYYLIYPYIAKSPLIT